MTETPDYSGQRAGFEVSCHHLLAGMASSEPQLYCLESGGYIHVSIQQKGSEDQVT